jgi:hypothetical protein
MENLHGIPKGCSVFVLTAPNAEDESAVSDDIQRLSIEKVGSGRSILYSEDQEGICTHKLFDREGKGIVSLLKQAVDLFQDASLYELVNEVSFWSQTW